MNPSAKTVVQLSAVGVIHKMSDLTRNERMSMTTPKVGKKIVTYQPCFMEKIEVGQHALVYGVNNHPYVEGTVVSTSKVLNYSPETGEFETLYSIYRPLK